MLHPIARTSLSLAAAVALASLTGCASIVKCEKPGFDPGLATSSPQPRP
jgi:hypothetical protein